MPLSQALCRNGAPSSEISEISASEISDVAPVSGLRAPFFKEARYRRPTLPTSRPFLAVTLFPSHLEPAVIIRQRLRRRHQIVEWKRVETDQRLQSQGKIRGSSKVATSQYKKMVRPEID
jgi:hypothetical protein